MTYLNKLKDDDIPIPITHLCRPDRVGKDMTGKELHEFGVSLLLTFLHVQGGNLVIVNMNPDNGGPHVVVENPNKVLLYVWIKTDLAPNVPVYKPTDNHEAIIKLAKQNGAIQSFASITISCATLQDNMIPKCGSEYYAMLNEFEEI